MCCLVVLMSRLVVKLICALCVYSASFLRLNLLRYDVFCVGVIPYLELPSMHCGFDQWSL